MTKTSTAAVTRGFEVLCARSRLVNVKLACGHIAANGFSSSERTTRSQKMNKRGLAISLGAVAISAGSSTLGMPSPIVRQGRAFSESLLGIRLHMSRWQIARTLLLSAVSVTLVASATVRVQELSPCDAFR